jgi:hypothetical protein
MDWDPPPTPHSFDLLLIYHYYDYDWLKTNNYLLFRVVTLIRPCGLLMLASKDPSSISGDITSD